VEGVLLTPKKGENEAILPRLPTLPAEGITLLSLKSCLKEINEALTR
jgi:hypothetical protein